MQGTFNMCLVPKTTLTETKKTFVCFENNRFQEYPYWGTWKISESQFVLKYDDGQEFVSKGSHSYFIGENEYYFWTITRAKPYDYNHNLGFQIYFNEMIINGEPDCFIKLFTTGHSWFISGSKALKFSPDKWRNLLTVDSLEEICSNPSDSNLIIEQVNGHLRFVKDSDEWTMPIENCRETIEIVADALEKYLNNKTTRSGLNY
jgi:hypothetical protein